MTWHVDGTGNDLTFAIESNGSWTIRGHGPHYCRPQGGDLDFISAATAVPELTWALRSPTTSKRATEGVSPGLWDRSQKTPSAPPAAISYFYDPKPSKALLFAEAIVSQDNSRAMLGLFKSIKGTSSRYRILFEFHGLRVPNTQMDV